MLKYWRSVAAPRNSKRELLHRIASRILGDEVAEVEDGAYELLVSI
jgi:hypothetical protein